jgi:hypothetical protein
MKLEYGIIYFCQTKVQNIIGFLSDEIIEIWIKLIFAMDNYGWNLILLIVLVTNDNLTIFFCQRLSLPEICIGPAVPDWPGAAGYIFLVKITFDKSKTMIRLSLVTRTINKVRFRQ